MRESRTFVFILTVSRIEAIGLTHGTRKQSATHYDTQLPKLGGGAGDTAVVITTVRSWTERPSIHLRFPRGPWSLPEAPISPGFLGRDIPAVVDYLMTLFQF